MQRVTVAARLPATRESVFDVLTPERLLELEGIYDVTEVEETADGWRVTGHARDVDDREVTVSVRKLPDGYAYETVDGGFLDVCRTTVRVDVPPDESDAPILGDPDLVAAAGGTVRVRWESEYSVGGPFSFIADWLLESERRRSLQTAGRWLAADLDVINRDEAE